MQYLKEDVRDAILGAAMKEFREKSFLEASMRSIAKTSGVTVGNIYRYFKNKDDLFNYIMDPVWNEVTKLIYIDFNSNNADFQISEMVSAIMDIYKKYDIELYILLNNSRGSKYENVKKELVDLIYKRTCNELLPTLQTENKELNDMFILKVISNLIVDGYFLIVTEVGNDIERINELSHQLLNIIIKDVHKRI
ncbi:TetR/AcrR family transcriptional regulator [Clostridium sp. UBA1652]|uniref:TetR/AcrR family transcriptional regulator n=1 Tax=Clostridium sp. UBA1652 TaxID=1946348 RepID=UPI002580040C|nr:TetR/AcrR family transcriptional regulator [Clostridium sp. UBA1652]